MFRNTFILVLLLLALSIISCAQKPGRAGYDAIKKIPVTKSDDRRSQFASYSVDDQIDIYTYASNSVEAGRDDFLRYLVSDGERKIPTILKRIDRGPDNGPQNKANLIAALELIDLDCDCLLRVDGSLDVLNRNQMEIHGNDIEGIRAYKKLYSEILQAIKNRSRR